MLRVALATVCVVLLTTAPVVAQEARPRVDDAAASPRVDYRVLATSKTSTLEKEMNEAAAVGFRFTAAMGGDTAIGGKEAVAVMTRIDGPRDRYEYRLLASNRTSTMQRELRDAAELGFEYRDQTVFETLLGGEEVVCILERHVGQRSPATSSYLLVATSRTSTLQKELQQAGLDGYELLGMTIGKTAVGGKELVAILRRTTR
jgi:hypothetical protein